MRRTHSTLVLTVATLGLSLGFTGASRTQALFVPLPSEVAAPADNPTTPEKVALGRLLFWDPLLSGQKDVSCATCHHPAAGYAENRDLSIGASGQGLGAGRTFTPGTPERFVKRNSQSIVNAAFNGMLATGQYTPAAAPMFWDSRVKSLEAQALEPLKAADEMRGDTFPEHLALSVVVSRINDVPEYRQMFARAFGSRDAVSVENLGRAIAAFERTIVAANAPFDRYMRGDSTAMTPAQIRGMNRFQTIGCINCHSGPMFSDYAPHVLGVAENAKLTTADSGAGQRFAFRTASLRNLASTAPYMHNGSLETLDDVVNFYRRASRGGGRGGRGGRGGGGFGRTDNPNVERAQLDPLLRNLNMRGRGGERDLLEFLNALNDPAFDQTIPDRVPSGLEVGGKIK